VQELVVAKVLAALSAAEFSLDLQSIILEGEFFAGSQCD
jgi:hypothetical protein